MRNYNEDQYLRLLADILSLGSERGDRTGVGTRGVFGAQLRFDLSDAKLPLLTTKKVFFRAVFEELMWMLRAETDVKPLHDKGITIWDEWATKEKCAMFGRREGDLGLIYGHQWRAFGAFERTTLISDFYGLGAPKLVKLGYVNGSGFD